MQITGIICEYNPLHRGHGKQIRHLKNAGRAVVCLMSGNFVQRGAPAIFDKAARAQAAVACGADLVLELPVTYALSSAEGFAAGGVKILSGVCDQLCFGAESPDASCLMATAKALLQPEFSEALKQALSTGISFPAARQAALESLGCDGSALKNPNDILAVEYCKAILAQGSSMGVLPIHRQGSYHDTEPDRDNPSATSLRRRITEGGDWLSYIPEAAQSILAEAPVYTLNAGERAILARLRTMTDGEFEALPYGSEGLWRKLMHASRSCAGVEEIASAVKSKRYTRTRIDRMILCAFLGLTAANLSAEVPYTRVLAFNETGQAILKTARQQSNFHHVGEKTDSPWWAIEQRCNDLYGLFQADSPAPAGGESKRRVYIAK